jgi:hypothetical protein
MKKVLTIIILGILSLSLYSCRSTRSYVYVGSEKVPFKSTWIIPACHDHFYVDTIPYCVWIREIQLDVTDTLIIETWKKKRVKY